MTNSEEVLRAKRNFMLAVSVVYLGAFLQIDASGANFGGLSLPGLTSLKVVVLAWVVATYQFLAYSTLLDRDNFLGAVKEAAKDERISNAVEASALADRRDKTVRRVNFFQTWLPTLMYLGATIVAVVLLAVQAWSCYLLRLTLPTT